MVHYLSDEDVLRIHDELVQMYDRGADPIDPPGPRDLNLVASACMRPKTSLGTVEKYKTLNDKAAALFFALAKNHAFHNGNKRTAFASLVTFLSVNKRRLRADVADDDLYNMVVGIAANSFPEPGHSLSDDSVQQELSSWLRERIVPKQVHPSDMRLTDFLDKAEQAGAGVKISGGSYVVSRRRHSIRIGMDSSELSGNVVKEYLKKLGLNRALTGIELGEFQEGVQPDQREIRRFRRVLDRLADA